MGCNKYVVESIVISKFISRPDGGPAPLTSWSVKVWAQRRKAAAPTPGSRAARKACSASHVRMSATLAATSPPLPTSRTSSAASWPCATSSASHYGFGVWVLGFKPYIAEAMRTSGGLAQCCTSLPLRGDEMMQAINQLNLTSGRATLNAHVLCWIAERLYLNIPEQDPEFLPSQHPETKS